MSDHIHKRGLAPSGDAIRRALRWLSDTHRHDLAAVEQACRQFDLSPLDEEFLIAEARRIARMPAEAADPAAGVIAQPDPRDERATSEGVRILENWNLPLDPAASIAQARLLPGEATEWHYLVDTAERYLVVRGRARVELGDRPPAEIGPGDVVFIPAGVAQRVACTGPEEFLFFCVCTPRFEERNYRAGKPGA